MNGDDWDTTPNQNLPYHKPCRTAFIFPKEVTKADVVKTLKEHEDACAKVQSD